MMIRETNKVESLMRAAADLLAKCGLHEQAAWFTERAAALKTTRDCTLAIQIMNEVGRILAGMGSFSDLPLRPNPGSGITEAEARDLQWHLVEKLGEAIEEATKTMESRTKPCT